MRYISISIALALITSTASAQLVNNAEKVNAMKQGVTTPEDISATFGEPEHIDKNPDGRFVHLYSLELQDVKNSSAPPVKGKISFLFDSERKLIRYRIYKQDQ